jgi:glycosyltransferase involved in cell wall biosynthesis
MKTVFFLPELDGGGAQRTLINLANHISSSQDLKLVVAQSVGPAAAWVSSTVPLVDLASRRTRSAVLPLAAFLRRHRPDIFLSTGLDANIVAWLAWSLLGSKRPRLILRETNSHRARGDLGMLRRWLIGAAYRRADRVVALSHGVRDELIALYKLNPDRVVTLHNPIALDKLAATAGAARKAPPPWTKTGPAVVAVGRLTRQKGFERLIEAVAALSVPGVQLVILGKGECRKALESLGQRLGLGPRLIMPGFVPDPQIWLAHADVFALSSRWEGFGHVIVEAMAAGVPVVAFDCPHGPRDIIRNEVNGLLLENGDVAALTVALQRVLSELEFAKRLQTAATHDARLYDLPTISKAYLDLFDATLSRASSSS